MKHGKHKVKMTRWSGHVLKVFEAVFDTFEHARDHAYSVKHKCHNVKIHDEEGNLVLSLDNTSEVPTYA